MVVAARAVKEVTVRNRILESGEQLERFKAGKRACSLILLRCLMSFPSYIFIQHFFVEWSKDKKAQTSSEHYSIANQEVDHSKDETHISFTRSSSWRLSRVSGDTTQMRWQ